MEKEIIAAIPRGWPKSKQARHRALAEEICQTSRKLLNEVARTQCVDITIEENPCETLLRRSATEWRARTREKISEKTGERLKLQHNEHWREIARTTLKHDLRVKKTLEAIQRSVHRIKKMRKEQKTGKEIVEIYNAQTLAEADEMSEEGWAKIQLCPKWLRSKVLSKKELHKSEPGQWMVETAWGEAKKSRMGEQLGIHTNNEAIKKILRDWKWPELQPVLPIAVAFAIAKKPLRNGTRWAVAIEEWKETLTYKEASVTWDPEEFVGRTLERERGLEKSMTISQHERAWAYLAKKYETNECKAKAMLSKMEQAWKTVIHPIEETKVGQRDGALCWLIPHRTPSDVLSSLLGKKGSVETLPEKCEEAYTRSTGICIPVVMTRDSITHRPNMHGTQWKKRPKGEMKRVIRETTK